MKRIYPAKDVYICKEKDEIGCNTYIYYKRSYGEDLVIVPLSHCNDNRSIS
jgi:hypothetical protein